MHVASLIRPMILEQLVEINEKDADALPRGLADRTRGANHSRLMIGRRRIVAPSEPNPPCRGRVTTCDGSQLLWGAVTNANQVLLLGINLLELV